MRNHLKRRPSPTLFLQPVSRKPHVPGYKKKKKERKHCFNAALNSCRGSVNKEPMVSGVLESVLCLNTAVYRPAGVFKSMPAREWMSLWNTKKDVWMDVASEGIMKLRFQGVFFFFVLFFNSKQWYLVLPMVVCAASSVCDNNEHLLLFWWKHLGPPSRSHKPRGWIQGINDEGCGSSGILIWRNVRFCWLHRSWQPRRSLINFGRKTDILISWPGFNVRVGETGE